MADDTITPLLQWEHLAFAFVEEVREERNEDQEEELQIALALSTGNLEDVVAATASPNSPSPAPIEIPSGPASTTAAPLEPPLQEKKLIS